MHYILIAWMSWQGSTVAPAFPAIEFNTLQACTAASDRLYGADHDFSSICVAKGGDAAMTAK